ncbi:carboxypeptidase M32 [Paenibacillus turpanensis]|uniref:carboxypeptidase M32 n=1 Tax=Paenibacillus turpanensis TaxID=2689078 RepID=UPI00140B1F5C|nr:carboxypeptidase M32 [Paenibacillus turpanensis]
MEAVKTSLQSFKELIQKIKSYEEAVSVMYWDLRTGAPKKSVPVRSETIGLLSTEMFKMSVSDDMGRYLEELMAPGVFSSLTHNDQRMLEEAKKDYDRSKKIPPELYQEYVILTSQAESAWEEAKPNNDFKAFQPYLEKIIEFQKKFIDLWGYEGNKYNTLLDMYEPGMTVEKLDQVFGELRQKLVPLVAAIAKAKQPEGDFLHKPFPIDKQREFSVFILEQIGYDFQAGRLDVTAHPFMTALNPGDARVTTRFDLEDMKYALFSTIHEGGHALYEQNIDPELGRTNLGTGTSMGIHESQSRFWENIVGRSRHFWTKYYGDLQRMFPEQLAGIDLDRFYPAINEVKPSLIRTESDELTYNLHIMIRYELEKQLINSELNVSDLPKAWNEKYEEYLGITPPSDTLGVLQDVHWSGGAFGYFPSYSLGNMYAAQMYHTMRKELPQFDELVEQGDFAPIRDWLTEHVYRFGKLKTPNEIIREVTGEELNPEYLVQYLEEKYKPLYQL